MASHGLISCTHTSPLAIASLNTAETNSSLPRPLINSINFDFASTLPPFAISTRISLARCVGNTMRSLRASSDNSMPRNSASSNIFATSLLITCSISCPSRANLNNAPISPCCAMDSRLWAFDNIRSNLSFRLLKELITSFILININSLILSSSSCLLSGLISNNSISLSTLNSEKRLTKESW